MAKIPRTHIEGALYYVTSRGDHNENIFNDNQDYETYLDLLRKYKEQYGFKLFAFVLMPNHLHLLIELKEGITISEIMHDLNANYTKYFNGKYKRKGHLFQERYKMVLLEKEQYLLPASVYIHLNPKIVGLISEIKDYQYSSYPLYAAEQSVNFNRLNLQDEIRQMSDYLNGESYTNVLDATPKTEMEVLGRDLSKKIILGREEFIEKVKAHSDKLKIQRTTEAPQMEVEAAYPYQKWMLAGVIAVLIMGVLTLYLYARSVEASNKFKQELARKEAEISARLAKEREFIHKDLEEKYSADRVSYEAMAKRLELEKQKIRKLEEDLNTGGVKQ